MCILLVKKAGSIVDKDVLEVCAENNADGNGFSYVNTDYLGTKKLITYKSLDFDLFYEKLRRAERNNPESNMLIHFRIGTSGLMTTHNCHPFQVSRELVFAHNGILFGMPKDPEGIDNDTRVFNEMILKKLPSNSLDNPAIFTLLEDFIGTGNKLAFLGLDNEVTIVNEGAGVWKDDVWYSNTSYRPRPVYKSNYRGTTYQPGARVVNMTSWVQCDYCDKYHQVKEMKAYSSFDEVEGYCKVCEKMLLDNNVIFERESRNLSLFIREINSEAARVADVTTVTPINNPGTPVIPLRSNY